MSYFYISADNTINSIRDGYDPTQNDKIDLNKYKFIYDINDNDMKKKYIIDHNRKIFYISIPCVYVAIYFPAEDSFLFKCKDISDKTSEFNCTFIKQCSISPRVKHINNGQYKEKLVDYNLVNNGDADADKYSFLSYLQIGQYKLNFGDTYSDTPTLKVKYIASINNVKKFTNASNDRTIRQIGPNNEQFYGIYYDVKVKKYNYNTSKYDPLAYIDNDDLTTRCKEWLNSNKSNHELYSSTGCIYDIKFVLLIADEICEKFIQPGYKMIYRNDLLYHVETGYNSTYIDCIGPPYYIWEDESLTSQLNRFAEVRQDNNKAEDEYNKLLEQEKIEYEKKLDENTKLYYSVLEKQKIFKTQWDKLKNHEIIARNKKYEDELLKIDKDRHDIEHYTSTIPVPKYIQPEENIKVKRLTYRDQSSGHIIDRCYINMDDHYFINILKAFLIEEP
jgi:hypothetical protein